MCAYGLTHMSLFTSGKTTFHDATMAGWLAVAGVSQKRLRRARKPMFPRQLKVVKYPSPSELYIGADATWMYMQGDA